ncbi:hypothetical protein KQX54_007939 [Cotesia glomerata]|uniref:Uncharacterized protein n=1 Tax=Cotesia glomerata TaxID=32391 RepID=A0AAV7J317_COTGL|nr:hypothetical protein KQX54_007939 [Cotesia glomerata]
MDVKVYGWLYISPFSKAIRRLKRCPNYILTGQSAVVWIARAKCGPGTQPNPLLYFSYRESLSGRSLRYDCSGAASTTEGTVRRFSNTKNPRRQSSCYVHITLCKRHRFHTEIEKIVMLVMEQYEAYGARRVTRDPLIARQSLLANIDSVN